MLKKVWIVQKLSLPLDRTLKINKMSYYKNQLAKIDLDSQYAPTVKIIGGESGQTKCMNINEESAKDLIEWLQANFMPKVSQYFEVAGYWKGDKTEFEGYIIKESDDVNENTDDQIFFYGLSEDNIKEAIELKENSVHEFVITEYKKI